jgi:hypothetical protein
MKSKTTKDLEQCALNTFKKLGTFLCFEVGINIKQEAFPIWYERALKSCPKDSLPPEPKKVNREVTEIVDLLTWEKNKNIWRCYEIKSSIQDFNSGHHITFVGHFNYYIMPKELYDKVKDKIPDYVGVYVQEGRWLVNVKKAKKQVPLVSDELFQYSLMKSLYRDVEKMRKELKKYKKTY